MFLLECGLSDCIERDAVIFLAPLDLKDNEDLGDAAATIAAADVI
jgi:hypothetical protein